MTIEQLFRWRDSKRRIFPQQPVSCPNCNSTNYPNWVDVLNALNECEICSATNRNPIPWSEVMTFGRDVAACLEWFDGK